MAKIREHAELNYTDYGVYFEVTRLGLLLPDYVDFMYDLVVHEKKQVGTKVTRRRACGRGGVRDVRKPVYKIISSIRIIRPEKSCLEDRH